MKPIGYSEDIETEHRTTGVAELPSSAAFLGDCAVPKHNAGGGGAEYFAINAERATERAGGMARAETI